MGQGLPINQRRWVMVTVLLAITMATLDGTIANVALPTIAKELKTTPSLSIWVISAYQLTLSMCLLPFAAIGDKIGYRKIYCAGLAVFTAGSLGCAISFTLPSLVAARIIQGMGAAGILSVNAALIRQAYPAQMVGKGIGLNAFVVALSSALGPTIASSILLITTWEWLFALNVPVGIIGLYIGYKNLPNSGHGLKFEWINAFLCAGTVFLLIMSIDGVGHQEKIMLSLNGFAFSFLLGFLLVHRELKVENPLFPVDLFKIPLFTASIATSVCSYIAQMAAFTSLPFYLQFVLERTEVETGLIMTPWPLTTGVMAIIAGRLSSKYAAGLLCGIGLCFFAVGLILVAELPLTASDVDILWRLAICGFGFGLFQTPNSQAILNASPFHRSSAAGGMMSTARLLGQTLGAALTALAFVLVPFEPTRFTLYSAGVLSFFAAIVSIVRLKRGSIYSPNL